MAGKSHRNRWRIFQCHRGTCQKECCRWDSLKITWKRLLYNLIISSNSITTNQDHHHHHPKSWSAGHHKVWPRVDGTVSTSTSISLHQFPGEVDISKVGAPSGKSSSKVVSGGPFSVISPKTSRQHMSTPVISEKPVQSKAKPSMNPKNLWDHSSSP